MNQLTGRLVVIVLSVREGRGFSVSQNFFFLEALLNGRKIQSDPVPVSSNPMFCTELVWEIEKKEIRKLRSSHHPLRVECFMVDDSQQKEKVGFVLLHLRSARPIPSTNLVNIDYKWYKLLGVHSDHKPTHPELAMALTIRDKLRDIIVQNPPPLVEQTIQEEILGPDECLESLTENLSVVYLEDGFLQIGEGENSKETYTLSFLLEMAFNFDLLLSKKAAQNTETEYYITLTFFDLTINTKNFCIDGQEPIILSDKIMFQLHSNADFLMTFFDQYKTVSLNLCQGSDVLAISEIDLKNLNTKQFFKEKGSLRAKGEQDCMLRSIITCKVPEGSNGRKPFVTTQTALVRKILENTYSTHNYQPIEKKVTKKPIMLKSMVESNEFEEQLFERSDFPEKEFEEKEFNKLEFLEDPEDTQACGDQNYAQDIILLEKKRSTYDISVQTSARENRIARSAFTNLKDVTATNNLYDQPIIYSEENYHLYSLTITFQTITWKQLFSNGFQFRFRHPKANTVLIVQCNSDQVFNTEPIILENVKCTQYFVSTPNFITTLVYTYPSKVTICNDESVGISEEFELYTKLFLTQNNKIANGLDVCSCSYSAIINDEHNIEEAVCELQIEMTLADCGLNPGLKYENTCYDLEPMVLDERLAFKTLKDLEIWKEQQQKIFEDRQKLLEAEKLKMLQTDWEKKRLELEIKLQTGVEKCRVLSEELIFAAHELESKKKTYDVQKRYTDNPEVIEMQVTQMMELEMNIKIEQIRKENIKLLEQINEMQLEKEKLKLTISKKETEFEDYKRTTLTEEQVKSLLQELRLLEEKYRVEQNAKIFFKEQWQKAVREVHCLKSADQKQIQMQIRKQKNELSQLSLEDYDKNSDSEGSSHSLMSCPSGEYNQSCVC